MAPSSAGDHGALKAVQEDLEAADVLFGGDDLQQHRPCDGATPLELLAERLHKLRSLSLIHSGRQL